MKDINFMGIEMNTPYSEFIEKLSSKEEYSSSRGTIKINEIGECFVRIETTNITNTVYSVTLTKVLREGIKSSGRHEDFERKSFNHSDMIIFKNAFDEIFKNDITSRTDLSLGNSKLNLKQGFITIHKDYVKFFSNEGYNKYEQETITSANNATQKFIDMFSCK